VAGFNKRVDEIERRLEHHQDQVTKIKDVVQLAQTDLRQFEVHTRKNNIEINGVPEVPKEDLLLLCIKLADALNVDLAKEHIDIVHRITSKNTQKPKPIILNLANRWKKELMIEANKWRKNADPQTKLPPTTTSLGLNDLPESDIYFNDHLAPHQRRLHTGARVLRKKLGGYSVGAAVWFKAQDIYLRRRQDSVPVKIESIKQLEELTNEWKGYFKQ